MVPLAVTSTNAMIKRLGGKRWAMLHRLTYVVAIGGVWHYFLIVKSDITFPALFALWVLFLLGWRVVAALRKAAPPAQ
jgi:sulfoxide reductase heme-binding subunit YedZ